jgi:hypothetical protein
MPLSSVAVTAAKGADYGLPAGTLRLDLPPLRAGHAVPLHHRLTIAFSSGWAGLIGFFVIPYTTLFYALVYRPGLGIGGLGVIVALGVLLDLSSLASGGQSQRRRARRPGLAG